MRVRRYRMEWRGGTNDSLPSETIGGKSGKEGMMPSKLRMPSVLAVIVLCFCMVHNARGQSVQIRDHKKVSLDRKTTLKIVKNDGLTLKGKWRMESVEAISIRLSSGKEVIVSKSDIAELYQCRTLTNEGFFYGFLIGALTTAIIIYFDKAQPRDASIFFASSLVGAFCGLIGAVYGSLRESCEQCYFDDLPPGITTTGNRGNFRPELGLCFRF